MRAADLRVTDHLVTEPEHKALLWRGVLEDTGHPALRVCLADIVRHYDVPTRDPRALARAVQDYVARTIVYMREAPELFVSAPRTLEMGIADCDDQARLVAALLRSAQVPVRLAFAGWCRPEECDGEPGLQHVWAEAWVPPALEKEPRWVALETVRRVPFGWSCAPYYTGLGFRVRLEHLGDESPVDPREHEREGNVQGVRGHAGAVRDPGGPLRW